MRREMVEECLEIMWHLKENNESDLESFNEHDVENFGEETLRVLERKGYLKITNQKISMTSSGMEMARQVVRRHRLAERLLTDVLGMKPDDVEKGACEFEHMLAPEVTESICTILGHPRLCPHGTRIPEGECCRRHQEYAGSTVVSLAKVPIGRSVKIAYINTSSDLRMQKILHFQFSPGRTITITQKYPSFVIRNGDNQVAMDEDIAQDIYVWKNGHDDR